VGCRLEECSNGKCALCFLCGYSHSIWGCTSLGASSNLWINMKKWLLKYQVRGTSGFPIDMLRYDAAYPDSETDSSKITRSVEHRIVREEYPNTTDEQVTVNVRSYCYNKTEWPTERRWQSFGWEVVPGSITWEKI
jgi:hypothetical protein